MLRHSRFPRIVPIGAAQCVRRQFIAESILGEVKLLVAVAVEDHGHVADRVVAVIIIFVSVGGAARSAGVFIDSFGEESAEAARGTGFCLVTRERNSFLSRNSPQLSF